MYTKKSEYWLKKKRLANERRFARMHPKEQNRIIRNLMRSTYWWSAAGVVVFLAIWTLTTEMWFVWVAMIFGILWGMFRLLELRRIKKIMAYRTIEQLQRMNPYDFEEYIVRIYNRLGYALKETSMTLDHGIDAIGKDKMGKKTVMQIKRYSDTNTVGSPEIREFMGSMAYHRADRGIFLTTGYFTSVAKDTVAAMEKSNIELVDKDLLIRYINQAHK